MRPQLDVRCDRSTKIRYGLTVCLLFANSFVIRAQTPQSTESAKEVLRAYRKMDAEGGRLSPSGWKSGSKYFLKPSRWPQYQSAVVVWGETDPYISAETSASAKLSFRCVAVGQIDSSGDFTFDVNHTFIDASGRQFRRQPGAPAILGPEAKLLREYDLVLTTKHWELTPGGESLREVKGPPEWRISHFEYQPWITIQAAIRYLTKLRDESSSEKVRLKANKSVATLERLLSEHK